MNLQKRIDLLKGEIKTKENMLEHYKKPTVLKKEIEYDKEILGYLEELQKLRKLVFEYYGWKK